MANLFGILNKIRSILWGDQVAKDIFIRWSQGFYFSTNEKSALEQSQGGPCAVIAPVQAYILRKLLTDYNDLSFRETMTAEMQREILVQALCEILQQCHTEKYFIVGQKATQETECNSVINGENSENEQKGEPSSELEPDPEIFHNSLIIHTFELITDVRRYYKENINLLGKRYGILLFLYSVIATKGPENLQTESGLETDSELLIHKCHGYGSQCLINLMITGKAVNHVWDNFQELGGGIKLMGIERQSQIGYISYLEHLRLITVGFNYKNPVHPVWILGSETHLTVLFSDNKRLVSPETKSEQAKRVFKSFDEGNNFIKSSLLGEVLTALELVDDQPYVDIMAKKLDQEGLGIILLNAFMEEFFPVQISSTPDEFTLYHYNGLPQSNSNQQVQYYCGQAVLLETDLLIHATIESNPMLNCLQTKWPNIDIRWIGTTPSLN